MEQKNISVKALLLEIGAFILTILALYVTITMLNRFVDLDRHKEDNFQGFILSVFLGLLILSIGGIATTFASLLSKPSTNWEWKANIMQTIGVLMLLMGVIVPIIILTANYGPFDSMVGLSPLVIAVFSFTIGLICLAGSTVLTTHISNEIPLSVPNKFCPECGRKVDISLKFCDNCGAKQPEHSKELEEVE